MLVTNLAHSQIVAASPDAAVRATGGYLMQRAFADMFNVKTLAGLLFRVAAHDDAGRPSARRATVRSARTRSTSQGRTTAPDVAAPTRAHADVGAVLRGPAQGAAGPPPGGSKRFLLTLADLDINDINTHHGHRQVAAR